MIAKKHSGRTTKISERKDRKILFAVLSPKISFREFARTLAFPCLRSVVFTVAQANFIAITEIAEHLT